MPEPHTRPGPRRRWLRWGLIGLAVLVLLPLAGLAAFLALFDAEALKPRIEAAVEQATGRDLTLAGPVGLKLSLVPTVTLRDVALANLPGGTRPEMLQVRQVEVQLALLPLLSRRLEVRQVLLDGPDLLLETVEGRPNWSFGTAPQGQPGAPAPGAAAPSAPSEGTPPELSVGHLAIREGNVTWRGAGPPRSLAIPRLEAVTTAPGGPMRLDGAFTLQDLPFTLAGEIGPPGALLRPGGVPWPVDLVLEAEGARLSAQGQVEQPAQRRGYRLALAATVPDLARFARLVPDVPLPPLGPLEARAMLADSGGGDPALSDLQVTVGASDLNALYPGLRLARLTASLPALDQPLALAAEGEVRQAPVALTATLGAPTALQAGSSSGPWPVQATLRAADATASLEGGIADPRALTGVDLALALQAPALASVAPLVPVALPPLRDLAATARLSERGPGFAAGAILRGIEASSSAGDLRGDLTYVIGARQGLTGSLASNRLDLDALRPAAASAPAASPAAAAQPAPAAGERRVIPDLDLPLEVLRVTDSDLRLAVAELVAGGVTYRDASAHLVIQDGKAHFDPLAATLPGGRVSGSLAADATAEPATARLAARSEGLELGPLLAAYGLPQHVTGRLELDTALTGRGASLRALAASLSGHLGLAMPGGQIDRSLLASLPTELRDLLGQGAGRQDIALRCLALRMQAQDGLARVATFLAETNLGRIGAEGGVNLREETLSLRLLPDLQVGPVQLRAPVLASGSLADPRFGVSPEAAVAGGIGAFLSLQDTPDRGLRELAQALGGRVPSLPECGAALAAARGGRAGPVPPAPAAPTGQAPERSAVPGLPRELQGPAQELLRGLFGR